MDSHNQDNQADVIEAFNSTSSYLDAFLKIVNPYFEGMVNKIYPPELQLNILKRRFLIYILLLLMDLFHLKFMVRAIFFFILI